MRMRKFKFAYIKGQPDYDFSLYNSCALCPPKLDLTLSVISQLLSAMNVYKMLLLPSAVALLVLTLAKSVEGELAICKFNIRASRSFINVLIRFLYIKVHSYLLHMFLKATT